MNVTGGPKLFHGALTDRSLLLGACCVSQIEVSRTCLLIVTEFMFKKK